MRYTVSILTLLLALALTANVASGAISKVVLAVEGMT